MSILDANVHFVSPFQISTTRETHQLACMVQVSTVGTLGAAIEMNFTPEQSVPIAGKTLLAQNLPVFGVSMQHKI